MFLGWNVREAGSVVTSSQEYFVSLPFFLLLCRGTEQPSSWAHGVGEEQEVWWISSSLSGSPETAALQSPTYCRERYPVSLYIECAPHQGKNTRGAQIIVWPLWVQTPFQNWPGTTALSFQLLIALQVIYPELFSARGFIQITHYLTCLVRNSSYTFTL